MTDKTGKTWMAIGETDDPNAIIENFETAADITKGDPVYFSADDKVSPATASQECIGVAVKTVSSGEMCPVLTRGRVKVKVGAGIARGAAVEGADASKRIVAATAYGKVLGFVLETTSAADDLCFMKVLK
jgi:hypothetical protein